MKGGGQSITAAVWGTYIPSPEGGGGCSSFCSLGESSSSSGNSPVMASTLPSECTEFLLLQLRRRIER